VELEMEGESRFRISFRFVSTRREILISFAKKKNKKADPSPPRSRLS